MHDQRDGLNNLILTFFRAVRRILKTLFNITNGIFAYCKKKVFFKKKNNLTNNKVGICKTFVCEFYWSCISSTKDL